MKIKILLLISTLFIFAGCKKQEKTLSQKIEYEDIKVKEVKFYQNNPKFANYSFDINIQLPKIISEPLLNIFSM